MRGTSSLVLTILSITFSSVIISVAIAEVLALVTGFAPGWQQYVFLLIVPSVATPIWAVPLVRANHQLARVRAELERLAHADPLSGLANRRAFFEHAQRIFDAAAGEKRPVAAMMIDIDRFKEINDVHGHDVGDAVVQAAAAAILREVKARASEDDCIVARLGGDEFAVVAAGFGDKRAATLAGQICAAVGRINCRCHGQVVPITASVGVAVRFAGQSIDTVLHRADKAVYAAKRDGRNCWRMALPQEPLPPDATLVPDTEPRPRVTASAG
jgi:diguanylate cyclase (GGDEF)-like protein